MGSWIERLHQLRIGAAPPASDENSVLKEITAKIDKTQQQGSATASNSENPPEMSSFVNFGSDLLKHEKGDGATPSHGAVSTRRCAQCNAPIAPHRPASDYRSPDCALAAPVEPWEPAPVELALARPKPIFVPPPVLCHECKAAEVGAGGHYCRECMDGYYQAHPDHRPPTLRERMP